MSSFKKKHLKKKIKKSIKKNTQLDRPNILTNTTYGNSESKNELLTEQFKADQNKYIMELVEQDNWEQIINLVKKGEITNLNNHIINGNTLFHLACVKGKIGVIRELLYFKNMKKIQLNTSLLNHDGLPAIHLYYKYGGTSPELFDDEDLCYTDVLDNTLALYVVNNIELLEKLIQKMGNMGCLENIKLFNSNGSQLTQSQSESVMSKLCAKYTELKSYDIPNANRYLELIKNISLKIDYDYIIYFIIEYDIVELMEFLIDNKFNFLTYNENNITPVTYMVMLKRNTMIEKLRRILFYRNEKYYAYQIFTESNRDIDLRPVFVSLANINNNPNDMKQFDTLTIIINTIEGHIDQYYEDNKSIYYFRDETDSFHNTYLHRVLTHENISNFPKNIVKFFINNTDLDQPNYVGDTSGHYLFKYNIWKEFKNILKDRTINLFALDELGNNCYSYINNSDKPEFLEFTKTIKIPPIIPVDKGNDESELITNMIKMNTKTGKREPLNYGLFNSNMIHYMLYLKYLMNKHKSLYIPVRKYDVDDQNKHIFLFNMSACPVIEYQEIMNRNVKTYLHAYYSYLPHNIYWHDEKLNYIDHVLPLILKYHDKLYTPEEHRYIMIKITIIVTTKLLHANCLIYDRLNKEAWRFEPYGITDLKNGKALDKTIHNMLTEIYGEIKYHDPDSYLSDLKFQLADGEDLYENKNLGDPGGYCLAWTLWFVDLVLSNPNKNVRTLVKDFFKKNVINKILSDEEDDTDIKTENIYLDFIRRYAHKLDNEKNLILIDMGFKNYHIYNSVMNLDMTNRLIDEFKIGESVIELFNKNQNK